MTTGVEHIGIGRMGIEAHEILHLGDQLGCSIRPGPVETMVSRDQQPGRVCAADGKTMDMGRHLEFGERHRRRRRGEIGDCDCGRAKHGGTGK